MLFILLIAKCENLNPRSALAAVQIFVAGGRWSFEAVLKRQFRVERSKVVVNMAARLDDMFSFCMDPDKVAGCVEVKFMDKVKVRTGLWVFSREKVEIYAATEH